MSDVAAAPRLDGYAAEATGIDRAGVIVGIEKTRRQGGKFMFENGPTTPFSIAVHREGKSIPKRNDLKKENRL